LTVLWIMVAMTALGLAATLAGRQAFEASRNRINWERAYWRAEDCLSRGQSSIDALLSSAPAGDASSRIWRALDTAVVSSGIAEADDCTVRLRAAGAQIDLNGDPELLGRELEYLYGRSAATGMLDALLDWRDRDSTERPLGAEDGWYVTQERHQPRNDSIASVRELVRVRGFESSIDLDSVFDVEPGRISIANASTTVLAAVPGFTNEVVSRIEQVRQLGGQVTDLLALRAGLSPAADDSLVSRFPDIERLTTLEPDAWVVTSRGVAGYPADTAVVELRIIRAVGRAVIVRRRVW
jgi:type II secretory pathway component PulK